jgi:hypothetical protein
MDAISKEEYDELLQEKWKMFLRASEAEIALAQLKEDIKPLIDLCGYNTYLKKQLKKLSK